MPRKLQLTWFDPRKCWKKRITVAGKKCTFYFKFGKSKTDMEGYNQALEAWNEKKAELSEREPTNNEIHLEKAIRFRERLAEYHRLEDDTNRSELFQSEAEKLRRLREKKNLTNNDVASLVETLTKPRDHEIKIWHDNLLMVKKHQEWNRPATDDKTVGHNADCFNRLKQAEVPNDLSPGRWDSLSRSVRIFANWVGRDISLDSVNGKTLVDFRTHLMESDRIGRKTGNDRIKDIRQFLRWCWQVEAMENLPRNLDGGDLLIPYDDPVIIRFDDVEVRQLFDGTNDRMKLYLLLALNCAMLPQDISDLLQSEVDWEEGRIKRKRSKTRKKKNANGDGKRKVPTVDYKLWQDTFDLLKQCRSEDAERVLLNENGRPLKRSEIGEDGKINNTSNIAKQYERLVKKLKIKTPKPLKTFRATGASKLEEHDVFARYAQYYLGQSPRSMADRHYVEPSVVQFDKALMWLGKQYKVK